MLNSVMRLQTRLINSAQRWVCRLGPSGTWRQFITSWESLTVLQLWWAPYHQSFRAYQWACQYERKADTCAVKFSKLMAQSADQVLHHRFWCFSVVLFSPKKADADTTLSLQDVPTGRILLDSQGLEHIAKQSALSSEPEWPQVIDLLSRRVSVPGTMLWRRCSTLTEPCEVMAFIAELLGALSFGVDSAFVSVDG